MSFNSKTILITGGTGSFGSYYAKMLLKKYQLKKLIIFSRDELKQYNLSMDPVFQKNEKKIRYLIGDVRDLQRVKLATNKVDIIIHAAALKQVPALEYNPFEAVKTNILGTENIIDASLRNNVKKLLFISTDKSVSPINLYGASKLCAERLVLSANNYSGNNKTVFSVARYGNVFGSRGSVINLFLEKIKNNQAIPITDKRMTRFNMQLYDCFNFVSYAISNMRGGEVFVPNLKSYRIIDLVSALEKKFDNKVKTKIIGLRPSEKLHEELISNHETTRCKKVSSNINVVYPDNVYKNSKLKFKPFGKKNYNSLENQYLSTNDLLKIINSYSK